MKILIASDSFKGSASSNDLKNTEVNITKLSKELTKILNNLTN